MVDPCIIAAKRMKEIRSLKNITQLELAKLIGLSRVSIANIESGNQKPTLETIYKFSIVMKVDLIDILPTKKEVLDLDSISGKDKDFILNLITTKNNL